MLSFFKSKPATIDPQLLQKNLDNTFVITSISVPKYRVKGNYVEYVVECTRMNKTWQVYRRYQQFKSLHGTLTTMCNMGTPYHCEYGVVPVLCASSWTEVTNQSPELVERRRRFLQIYLQQLLVPTNLFYVAKTALYSFLHDGEVTVVYKSRAQTPLTGLCALPDKNGEVNDSDDFETCHQHTGQILASTSAKLKSPEDVVASSIPDFASGGASKTFGAQRAGEQLRDSTSTSKDNTKESPVGVGDLASADGAKEKCRNCGELTPIDYELEMWEEYGRCAKCGRYGLHELMLPSDPALREGSTDVERPPPVDAAEEDPEVAVDEELQKSIAEMAAAEEEAFDDDQLRPRPVFSETPRREESSSAPSEPVTEVASSPEPAAPMIPLSERVELAAVIPEDFELVTTLGRGTFGKVMKVRFKKTGEIFAMKVLSKSTIYKRRMIEYIKEEKAIMSMVPQHPFICFLHFAFQTLEHVYLIMDYLPGGELYAHIYPHKTLREPEARFYIAECVLALEHLHKCDVVHRDIKPENIVLDKDGHVKLTDFGLARKDFSRIRRRSFVGSAEYLAPETIQGDVQTKGLDWWSVGVMLFEMLSGAAPFHAATNNDVYQSVLHKTLDFNKPCFSKQAQSLLSQLLEKDPSKRLVSPALIKKHPFFAGLDWDAMLRCEVQPPFVPDLGVNDTKYFHRDFTSEWANIQEVGGSTRQTLEILTRRFSNFHPVKDNQGTVSSKRISQPIPQELSASPETEPLPGLGLGVLSSQSIPDLVDPGKFTGVWRLLTVEWITEDGRVAFPWGSEVAGMLIYTRNGLFTMQITPIKRRKFRVGTSDRITKEEMGEAYCSFGSTFGYYEVHPGKNYITHHQTASLCPNLSGASQRRYFEFGDATLKLSSGKMELPDNITARFRLTWERSSEAAEISC